MQCQRVRQKSGRWKSGRERDADTRYSISYHPRPSYQPLSLSLSWLVTRLVYLSECVSSPFSSLLSPVLIFYAAVVVSPPPPPSYLLLLLFAPASMQHFFHTSLPPPTKKGVLENKNTCQQRGTNRKGMKRNETRCQVIRIKWIVNDSRNEVHYTERNRWGNRREKGKTSFELRRVGFSLSLSLKELYLSHF